jgi:hypothetical protein
MRCREVYAKDTGSPEGAMIIVEKKLLMWNLKHHAQTPYNDRLEYTKKFSSVDAGDYWKAHVQILKDLAPGISEKQREEIKKIYMEWVRAPANVGPNMFLFQTTDRTIGVDGVFESVQQNTQVKFFETQEDLFRALLGNYRAAEARDREEKFAFAVLQILPLYEKGFLNGLIMGIAESLNRKQPYSKKGGESVYGPVATVDWSTDDILQEMSDREPHVRLYRKIAAIHDFCLFSRFKTPGRGDHSAMRIGKYSLNEKHEQVLADRRDGVSIWAGTSGSTMDMVFGAIQLGLNDPISLHQLANCIAAFFHFMPTNRSSTHTYHEVMRGAKSICPYIAYQPNDTTVPLWPRLTSKL